MTARTRAAHPPQPSVSEIQSGPSLRAQRSGGDASTSKKIVPTAGSGHLHLSTTGSRAGFSTLQATYPLKLLAPSPLPSQPTNLSLAYTLAYGGGLVAGDAISLKIEIEDNGGLILLTQGSTKVFKSRPGIRPLSHAIPISIHDGPSETIQRMHVKVRSGGLVLVLPDSISPFHGSMYRQSQRFVLPQDKSGSALILDWVNSGRGMGFGQGQGEIWMMERYDSVNEIIVGEELVMRERMNLVSPPTAPKSVQGQSEIARRLAPYHVYATVLIYGPHLIGLLQYLRNLCDTTTQFQLKEPLGLIWSFSDIDGDHGCAGVLRLAAKSVEDARIWIRQVFLAGGIRELVGDGVWPRVI